MSTHGSGKYVYTSVDRGALADSRRAARAEYACGTLKRGGYFCSVSGVCVRTDSRRRAGSPWEK